MVLATSAAHHGMASAWVSGVRSANCTLPSAICVFWSWPAGAPSALALPLEHKALHWEVVQPGALAGTIWSGMLMGASPATHAHVHAHARHLNKPTYLPSHLYMAC